FPSGVIAIPSGWPPTAIGVPSVLVATSTGVTELPLKLSMYAVWRFGVKTMLYGWLKPLNCVPTAFVTASIGVMLFVVVALTQAVNCFAVRVDTDVVLFGVFGSD